MWYITKQKPGYRHIFQTQQTPSSSCRSETTASHHSATSVTTPTKPGERQLIPAADTILRRSDTPTGCLLHERMLRLLICFFRLAEHRERDLRSALRRTTCFDWKSARFRAKWFCWVRNALDGKEKRWDRVSTQLCSSVDSAVVTWLM
jgi:hypothetical protein